MALEAPPASSPAVHNVMVANTSKDEAKMLGCSIQPSAQSVSHLNTTQLEPCRPPRCAFQRLSQLSSNPRSLYARKLPARPPAKRK